MASGRLAKGIAPVAIPSRTGEPKIVDRDEHPRETSVEAPAKLRPFVRADGAITAGNSSGVNDGACAMLIASEAAVKAHGLNPIARYGRGGGAGITRTLGQTRALHHVHRRWPGRSPAPEAV
jgi:acetyl-CoA acetyltransferase